MKGPQLFRFLVIVLFVQFVTGCSGDRTVKTEAVETAEQAETAITSEQIEIGTETQLLLTDLAENGDYVNSREFPSLIKASAVFESLGNTIHIVDIRPAQLYAQGHIKGSVNKRFEDLPGYFESGIKPFEFDKIILIDENGQVSSYTAALLRMMGYGNVFAMRWGMSAWNKQFATTGWLSGLSGKYESALEQTTTEKPAPAGMPEINTGLSTGQDISAARFSKIFAEGTQNVLISADDVFADPGQYYVINYERKDKYDDGHIPGAVRYKPNATLGITAEMATIPADKTVVVYCGTGHNSGFVTAYLRLFGYDARTLTYGNNGFMHNRMVEKNDALSYLPFSEADINDFPVVK